MGRGPPAVNSQKSIIAPPRQPNPIFKLLLDLNLSRGAIPSPVKAGLVAALGAAPVRVHDAEKERIPLPWDTPDP